MKKKKNNSRLLMTAVMIAACLGVCAQMEHLPNTPADQFICSAHPQSGIVYLAGQQAVYKSQDNGDSWETVFTFDTSSSVRFFGLRFGNEHTGFATCAINGKNAASSMIEASSAPLLYKTVDGGVSWQCIDTSHFFTNIQLVNQDTLFAIEQYQGALFKSVDGGYFWENILDGRDLCDYSIVDGRVLYALHGTSYLNEWNATSPPDPIVYKSSDGGATWTTIRPADSSRGPRVMDQIFFHDDGSGVVLGHDVMFTENDFSTYEIASAGFPSAPEGWCLQFSTLKSGFQTATSWNPLDMSGGTQIRVSRDYGLHSTTIGSAQFPCESVGCEADTSFFIVTLNNVYRVKGYDFPNVGVPEHEAAAVNIYPNPTADLLHIELSGAGIAGIALYDLQGRAITGVFDTPQQGGTATINVKNVPAGVYVLRVTDTDGKEHRQKIVVR